MIFYILYVSIRIATIFCFKNRFIGHILMNLEKNKGFRHFFADIYVALLSSFTFVYLQFKACFFFFAPWA